CPTLFRSEEAPGGGEIAPFSKHEVERLPVAIHSAIEVAPTALHLDVCFIHPPRASRRSFPGLCPRGDQRSEFHHPAVQRGVVYRDAPLTENFLKITIGDGIANIKEHRVKDHRLRIMHALEFDHAPSLSPTTRKQWHIKGHRRTRNFATLPSPLSQQHPASDDLASGPTLACQHEYR